VPNEIFGKYNSGFNLDAYVFKKADDEIFDEADGGDTFEVWADGNVLNYDIPMTDQGDGFYSVDFPTAITTEGVYRIIIKLRVGANAAVGDIGLFQGELTWDGTGEIDIFTLDNTMNILLAAGSRVLNIYGPGE
jgi:hypothetical protein